MSTDQEHHVAVDLEAVSKTFGRGQRAVRALDAITAQFATRQFTAIMGPSGSGKTTLLQCAAGLERPTSGRVIIAGADLTRLNERTLTKLRRRHIGFVFQHFNLIDALTAAQNVALPLRLDGRRPKRATIANALEVVGLADRANHRPSELSGGQQQRVAIARALVTKPDIIFADEPTGALDSTSGRAVLELLRHVVDHFGCTVMMVTHDAQAAAYADSVKFLKDGRGAGTLTHPSAARISAHLNDLDR